jgi:hypothetical protein
MGTQSPECEALFFRVMIAYVLSVVNHDETYC